MCESARICVLWVLIMVGRVRSGTIIYISTIGKLHTIKNDNDNDNNNHNKMYS